MTNRNFIKTILTFHGFSEITILTKKTGTSDGQFENMTSYEIIAKHKKSGNMYIRESCFAEAVYEIFRDICRNDYSLEFVSQENLKKLLSK